ncbi:uncharacterized protein [Watersipora subatra]
MADCGEALPPQVDKGARVMCGHCKYTCQDIEELKLHMKANHLQSFAGLDGTSLAEASPEPEARKQTVVVYKQNADGTTVNTGQVVRLTQSQILQLINTSNGQQKSLETPGQAGTDVEGMLPIAGSTVSMGGKKQLAVVGPENVATLEKTAMVVIEPELMKTRTPASASAARVSLLAAGVPSFISRESPENEEEGTVDLKFRFSLGNNQDLIGEHIKPVVVFQCQYCGYKDNSYVKACVHSSNFHLSADGSVLEDTKTVPKSDTVEPQTVTEADLQCPYCLLKFFTLDDRDMHRLKKCGPKQRYEVKRTAVRSLQKHLLCNVSGCTRALYFSDHPQTIRHPRATFGICHRNNGTSHYFTCYACAAKSLDPWKEKGASALDAMVSDRVKMNNDKLIVEAAVDGADKALTMETNADNPITESGDADDTDSKDTSADKTKELSCNNLNTLEPIVSAEDMRPWDFASWSECSQHLLAEHSDLIDTPPQCPICKKQITSCNTICHHLFNHEIEYIENGLLNLKRRESKKAAKRGLLFGLAKDNPGDKMLFNDLSGGDFAAMPPKTDPETGAILPRPTTRNRHFMCRTCGQGFGSAAKRNKHILSNACLRDKVIKNYECSVCKKKFSTRKTVVAHETWCLYKQKRDAVLKETGEAEGGEEEEVDTVTGPDGSVEETKRVKRKRAAKFKCTIDGCIMGFNTSKELDIHLKCHLGNTVAYRCCFCEFTAAATVNWYPLKEHIIAKHPGHIPSAYECSICMKGFAKQSKYDDHMTKHSTDRHHKCIECGLTFKQESGLRTHVQYEHGTDEAKEFARMTMKQRANDNHAPQPMLCYVCGYATTSRSYYKTHMNIHKGVKPYNCQYCDYKSVDSTCFKRHMWRHQEKKPYKCTYCPFDGIQRSQIVAHMRTKHNVWPDEARKLIKHISGRSASNVQRPRVLTTGNSVQVPTEINMADTDISGQTETSTTTVSIVNPDGSETTIPVELITQAAQGLAAGTNLQVAYGDYMINYTLEKAPGADEGMEGQGLSEQALEPAETAIQVVQSLDAGQPMEVTHIETGSMDTAGGMLLSDK